MNNLEPGAPEQNTETAPAASHSKTISFRLPTGRRLRPPLPIGNRSRSGLLALAFVAIALIGGYAGGYAENSSNHGGLVTTGLSGQKKIATSQSQLISQIAKTVGPSVVSVNVSIAAASSQGSLSPFGYALPSSQEAAGTGIIISSSGIVVTNRHVVPEGTTKVSITLSDGTELQAVSVLGRTNASDSLDIAFLKISDPKGHKLVAAGLGDSNDVQVGDDVVAIGNALGQFQNTVTNGIISGYGRSVQASGGGDPSSLTGADTENLDNLFQTDAAINEGNSGGPLTNLNGLVIGINTAVAGNAQNIGFAIPINDVKGLISQVLKTGNFERPYLGVHYIALNAAAANQFGLAIKNGAFIVPSTDPTQPSVVGGSPADKAGLKDKDVITQLNSDKIDQTHSLISLLGQHQPGDKITLTIVRDSKTLKLAVTLGALPTN